MTTKAGGRPVNRKKPRGAAVDLVAELLRDESFRKDYEISQASTEFAEQIRYVLAEGGISQAVLAERIEKSPSHISQALDGHANLTLGTMVEIASAVEQEVHVRLRGRAEGVSDLFLKPLPAAGSWMSVETAGHERFVAGWPRSKSPSPDVTFDPGQPADEGWREREGASKTAKRWDDLPGVPQ